MTQRLIINFASLRRFRIIFTSIVAAEEGSDFADLDCSEPSQVQFHRYWFGPANQRLAPEAGYLPTSWNSTLPLIADGRRFEDFRYSCTLGGEHSVYWNIWRTDRLLGPEGGPLLVGWDWLCRPRLAPCGCESPWRADQHRSRAGGPRFSCWNWMHRPRNPWRARWRRASLM